jgi:predicted PurR-regulated permease PerM
MKNRLDPIESPSYKQHKKQTFTEIWLPIIVAIVVCAFLLILAISMSISDGGTVAKLSDISIILMIVPVFLMVLLTVIVIAFMNRGLRNLDRSLPVFFDNAQKITFRITSKIQNLAALLSMPVIRFKSLAAGVKSILKSLGHKHQ